MAKIKLSQRDYEKMLDKLEKNGHSSLSEFTNIIHATATILAVAGGAACAPTVAALVGATSISGVTSIASFLGVTAVAATPIGWVAGTAVAGGMIVYGLGKLLRSGGAHCARKISLRTDILEKIQKCKSDFSEQSDDRQFREVIRIMKIMNYSQDIDKEDGLLLIGLLASRKISNHQALECLETIARGGQLAIDK